MTLDALIIFSGAAVAVLPFLGFPNSWDSVIFLLLGILIVSLGIVVRRRGARLGESRAARDMHFAEARPVHTEDQMTLSATGHEEKKEI